MVRLISCISIVASSIIFAQYFSSTLKNRVNQLSELSRMFHFLKNEVRIFNTTIPDIFCKIENLSDDYTTKIFRLTNESLRENPGIGMEYAWKNAVRESSFYLSLAKEDMDIIKNFGAMLEKCDSEGQMRNIGYIISKLNYLERKAVESRLRNQRLINSAGVFGGLAISILLY